MESRACSQLDDLHVVAVRIDHGTEPCPGRLPVLERSQPGDLHGVEVLRGGVGVLDLQVEDHPGRLRRLGRHVPRPAGRPGRAAGTRRRRRSRRRRARTRLAAGRDWCWRAGRWRGSASIAQTDSLVLLCRKLIAGALSVADPSNASYARFWRNTWRRAWNAQIWNVSSISLPRW